MFRPKKTFHWAALYPPVEQVEATSLRWRSLRSASPAATSSMPKASSSTWRNGTGARVAGMTGMAGTHENPLLGGELPTDRFCGARATLVISMGFLWGQVVHNNNWGEL